MYSLAGYESMLADDVRVRAYLDAIARVVRPGDVVVEIGTGVGYFAVAACRAGAARVYAIESSDAVRLGPAVAAANGCADRISFVHGSSERTSLPERGDVLIEDLRGVLPLNGSRFETLADARRRLLHPGARRVPRADTLWAAPARFPAALRENLLDGSFTPHGIDVSELRRYTRNGWHRARALPDDLLGPPRRWAEIALESMDDRRVEGEADWTLEQPGRCDGWCVWFDSELADGVSLRNSPGEPPAIYGQAFFPLEQPLMVASGDQLRLRIGAVRSEDDFEWHWESTHARNGEEARWRQSSLAGRLLDTTELRATALDARPVPGLQTEVYATILAAVDGRRTIAEIARALAHRHPRHFPTEFEAARFIARRLQSIARDDALHGDATALGTARRAEALD